LNPDRDALYELLDARTREMFRPRLNKPGLLSEIAGLLEAGCIGSEKPFESLGYKQALANLRGAMALDEAIASTQLETRQYAKRQWTWFRREREITWLDGFGDSQEIFEKARDLLRIGMLR
jgi:tRNA dimethylallyltransferase